jgi:hypothetical protein
MPMLHLDDHPRHPHLSPHRGRWYLVHRHADQRVRDQGTAGSGGLMFAVLLTTARNTDIVEGATRAERKSA